MTCSSSTTAGNFYMDAVVYENDEEKEILTTTSLRSCQLIRQTILISLVIG
jgi:hypothetical protein